MDVPKKLAEHYRNFFGKDEAGEYFVAFLLDQIDQSHEAAEKDPDHARDFVQRAKGVRNVLDHIRSATAEQK